MNDRRRPEPSDKRHIGDFLDRLAKNDPSDEALWREIVELATARYWVETGWKVYYLDLREAANEWGDENPLLALAIALMPPGARWSVDNGESVQALGRYAASASMRDLPPQTVENAATAARALCMAALQLRYAATQT